VVSERGTISDGIARTQEQKARTQHGGSEHVASTEAKAQRIVGEEMGRRGWCEPELDQRRKADEEKPFSCINVERELHRSIVNPGKCHDFMLQRETH